MTFLPLLIYNVCVQKKMWWDIIVWNANENIGLMMRLFNSFAFKRIVFICWYWYNQNILNLTHLLLYIYISGIILHLTKSDFVLHPFVFDLWIVIEFWVIQEHLLFGVTTLLRQLKFLGVLCSLCKVTEV